MSQETFRVAQCNILNQSPFLPRYKLLAETVKHHKVDYLFAQEVVDTEAFTKVFKAAGYSHIAFSEKMRYKDLTFYLATVGKTPFTAPKLPCTYNTDAIMCRQTVYKGQVLNLFNAHLAHGFDNEPKRVESVEIIDTLAERFEKKNAKSISILGGDLNALPDSRSVRYLRGLDLDRVGLKSTLWVDAWETCGKPENWTTNDHAVNDYGRATARASGVVLPEHIPARRIDYLMARGWRYGKTGCPVAFEYLKHPLETVFTDHEPVYADFLLL